MPSSVKNAATLSRLCTLPQPVLMNSTPKVVVSTTLKKADWNNSTVIGGDVVATLAKLKTESEKDVRVVGFLSHVQVDLAAQAQKAGCNEVMPRSAFTQNLASILSVAKD